MEPRNMAEGRLGFDGSRAFVRAWQVDYVLVKDTARARWTGMALPADRVTGCPLNLYRISG
jgi:hypothetical protein